MDLKTLLNKEQYEGAVTVDGQVLILAGAGSGKTRVLTYRMAHMIEDLNIPPYKILAITFTNKAAKEMKDRVKALVGETAESMWISTFHSTCVRILRREIEHLGYKSNFTIYDTSDQKTLITECMKALNINDKDITSKEIIGKIGSAKDKMQSAASFKREHESNYRENKIADVYVMYQKRLKENNALDFDDLIFKTVELFEKNPDVLEFYQRKFQYIMVDEYQDTNGAQYKLVKLLAEKYKNICVVGDDDQCLAEGTLINKENEKAKIEDIKVGDKVQVAIGNGEIKYKAVDSISKKEYRGNLIKIETKSGKVINGTPSHIAFSKVKVKEELYYVYLMYKKEFGYRIGQTSSVRSRDGEKVSGLAVRLNGEQADKIWIIKVCNSKSEATFYEEYYSVTYGIPKWVFNARGRSLCVNQDDINRLFNTIDTLNNAEKLMNDEFLYKEYPHHMSTAVIRGNTARKRVNVSFFGGKKNSQGVYSHRIGVNSSGEEFKEKLIKDGFNVRDGQRNTFRVETERANYDEAEEFAKSLIRTLDDFEVTKRAKLTKEENFLFMPLGSIKEGMDIVTVCDGTVICDEVKSVKVIEYDGFVYDLNIGEVRNYIADNVVVHNCIYAWRGADINNILDFEKDYPGAKVIKLEQNYRSKGNILNAANVVIAHNAHRKDKALRTQQEAGSKIKVYRAFDDRTEGEFVAKTIADIKFKDNRKYEDFAVLYRTNAQSRIFEEAFRRKGIAYKIVGGTRFYDRKEIKDLISYLKILVNPKDDISLKRIINVPKRSIGDATVQKVQDFADNFDLDLWDALSEARSIPSLTARNATCIEKFTTLMDEFVTLKETVSVSLLIESILKDTGYLEALEKSNDIEDKSRIENLKELVSDAVDFEKTSEDKTLEAYLEKVSLVQDTDKLEDEEDGEGSVVLMTIHSAKGLEFPVVFMVGMENGLFPSVTDMDKEDQMEEARRLCYVAITRAKESLYMTSAEIRRVFGRTVSYSQSDFIGEIKSDLKEYLNERVAANNTRYSETDRTGGYNRNPHGIRSSMYSQNRVTSPSGITSVPGVRGNASALGGKTLTSEELTLGRKVKHEKFGTGTIVSITPSGNDKKLTIAFDKQGVKILLLSLAKLEAL
ncbi:MAG: 3'-5' exonuclease [Clostridiaceae bacterium]|nr:3'-5' exonuclease [Clostridiaceae bacterium]